MFDMSYERAAWLLNVSNTVLVIGAIFTLSATIGSIWASSVKSTFDEVRQNETELAVANATSASKAADARAADANLAAARANERSQVLERNTADLQRQAEEAKAEAARVNERIQKMQSIRKIKPEHADALKRVLTSPVFAAKPGIRIIVGCTPDSESGIYAQEFINLFLACGIRTNPNLGDPHPRPYVTHQPQQDGFDMIFAINPKDRDPPRPEFLAFYNTLFDLGHDLPLMVDENIEVNDSRLVILRRLQVA